MIKSPLNYMGGKFKLLPQLLPLFPKNINIFYDVFGGGFNVGINVNAPFVVYNDKEYTVTNMLRYFYRVRDTGELLREIDGYIKKYDLSKTNKEGFLQLRADYNAKKVDNEDVALYALICYGFNNQIRFNKKHEFNVSFGKDRSSFNPVLRNRFIDFHKALIQKNIYFYDTDFEKICELAAEEEPSDRDKIFLYFDPPYINSVSNYTRSSDWSVDDEVRLRNCADHLNEAGIKFAISNNFSYNNSGIKEWSEQYNVYHLDADYSHCGYQKKDKNKTDEVLITNY